MTQTESHQEPSRGEGISKIRYMNERRSHSDEYFGSVDKTWRLSHQLKFQNNHRRWQLEWAIETKVKVIFLNLPWKYTVFLSRSEVNNWLQHVHMSPHHQPASLFIKCKQLNCRHHIAALSSPRSEKQSWMHAFIIQWNNQGQRFGVGQNKAYFLGKHFQHRLLSSYFSQEISGRASKFVTWPALWRFGGGGGWIRPEIGLSIMPA